MQPFKFIDSIIPLCESLNHYMHYLRSKTVTTLHHKCGTLLNWAPNGNYHHWSFDDFYHLVAGSAYDYNLCRKVEEEVSWKFWTCKCHLERAYLLALYLGNIASAQTLFGKGARVTHHICKCLCEEQEKPTGVKCLIIVEGYKVITSPCLALAARNSRPDVLKYLVDILESFKGDFRPRTFRRPKILQIDQSRFLTLYPIIHKHWEVS